MKAADVKSMLEGIVGQEAEVTVNQPFNEVAPEGFVYRNFDVIYSAGGVSVYVEAELARRKRDFDFPISYLVTPAQQKEYGDLVEAEETRIMERARAKWGKEFDEGRIFPSEIIFAEDKIPHITGVLVDSPEDYSLETANVRTAVVQHHVDLTGLAIIMNPEEERIGSRSKIKKDNGVLSRGYFDVIGLTSLESLTNAIRPKDWGYWKAKKGEFLTCSAKSADLPFLFQAIQSIYTAGRAIDLMQANLRH